jgi:hypothetical protein
MPRYIWTDDGFVERSTGLKMHVRDPNAICTPTVIRDVPEYQSPIDGKLITSRSHQREDLKRNDCVLAEPKKPRGYRNERFARKYGLKLNKG